MRNLTNIMASHESLIAEALDLDRGKMNSSKKFHKNPFTADNPFFISTLKLSVTRIFLFYLFED